MANRMFPQCKKDSVVTVKPSAQRNRQLANLTMLFLLVFASLIMADEVEIVNVDVTCKEMICGFRVTVKHEDEGWQHYANAWQVKLLDGTVVGTRELLHPHVDEQPFTRSLSGVSLPKDTREVQVCGRDNVHGWSALCREVKINSSAKADVQDSQLQ